MCSQYATDKVKAVPSPAVCRNAGGTTGSRRRRLWDLPLKSHCPVIGVCLPLLTLRKLVGKCVGGEIKADDYEIHIGAVVECGKRNALSEALQKYLEQRYAPVIQQFSHVKTPLGVWELWAEAVNRGDVAGPFWAALTHPRCDEQLQDGLIRDMHMLQHQAGATVRVDLRKMEDLQEQNAALAEALQKLQERYTKQIGEKIAEVELLSGELSDARATIGAKESALSLAANQLQTLQSSIPDLDDRLRQQQRLQEMDTRRHEQEARIQALEQKLRLTMKQLDIAKAAAAAATAPNPDPAEKDTVDGSALPGTLIDQTVLCVGGRTGNVPAYRQVVERVGGQFAYHDGGLEDSHSQLEASLIAADMVICQTGCVSHNAYWRVKDFCKRNGKPCVFVDNPSVSSLARSLQQVFQIERIPN